MHEEIRLYHICDNYTKAKILDFLCTGKLKEFNAFTISKKIKMSPSGTISALQELANVEILGVSQEGKQKNYVLNHVALLQLFEGLVKGLSEEINEEES